MIIYMSVTNPRIYDYLLHLRMIIVKPLGRVNSPSTQFVKPGFINTHTSPITS